MVGMGHRGNFKTNHPEKTLVIRVRKDRLSTLDMLISAYADDLPTELKEFLLEAQKQIGTSHVD